MLGFYFRFAESVGYYYFLFALAEIDTSAGAGPVGRRSAVGAWLVIALNDII